MGPSGPTGYRGRGPLSVQKGMVEDDEWTVAEGTKRGSLLPRRRSRLRGRSLSLPFRTIRRPRCSPRAQSEGAKQRGGSPRRPLCVQQLHQGGLEGMAPRKPGPKERSDQNSCTNDVQILGQRTMPEQPMQIPAQQRLQLRHLWPLPPTLPAQEDEEHHYEQQDDC